MFSSSFGSMFRSLWFLSSAISVPVRSFQYTCEPQSVERLLRQLDQWNLSCVDVASQSCFDRFKEQIIAQTFEEQRQPIGVVLFTNASTESRAAFQRALCHSIIGSYECQNAALLTISEPPDIHKARQRLQQQLANTLQLCPEQRKLIFVDSIEHLGSFGEYEQLSLLDVFLDPLNGARASCMDPTTGRVLDASNSIFVFVYRHYSLETQILHNHWKEFLAKKWSIENQNQMEDITRTTLLSKFTPTAFLGRVTLSLFYYPAINESCHFFSTQIEKSTIRSTSGCGVQTLYFAIGFIGYLYLFILVDQGYATKHGKARPIRFHSGANRIRILDNRMKQMIRKRKIIRLQSVKRKMYRNAKFETLC